MNSTTYLPKNIRRLSYQNVFSDCFVAFKLSNIFPLLTIPNDAFSLLRIENGTISSGINDFPDCRSPKSGSSACY